MAITENPEVTLSLIARKALLPVAVTFVEKSALAFGMEESDALPLTLACEEIFVYLCRRGAPEQQVSLRCRSGGFCVEAEFQFQPQEFDLRAFNLTAIPSLEQESDIEESSLLIASRMVDRFHFAADEHGLCVTLIKERTYPEISPPVPAVTKPLGKYHLRSPEPEELKELVRLVHTYYSEHVLPTNFRYPGKVVDMALADVYRSMLATDRSGSVGGGMVWRFLSPKTIICHGPYIFGQPQESAMARELVEACIESVAKSEAVGVINRYPTPQLPQGYFEQLGSLTHTTADGAMHEAPIFYRHLHEDHGATVWGHPLLQEFLENEYQRMFFAREIKMIRDEGEMHSRFSVISAEFDKPQNTVILRPLWWGDDAEETLADNVDLLKKDGIHGIFFEMDLAKPWHCYFSPALQKSAFHPRIILPYSGKGDVVIFQHRSGV